ETTPSRFAIAFRSRSSAPRKAAIYRQAGLKVEITFCVRGVLESLIPKISQETLAEMIGTTRSRVSFFMNRFRKLGFIQYNGGIKVHKSLLNVILHD
ncbi:MAG: helix-turn-helix domain-containing protein, partial [Terracidiphilus sp.]